ncbi:polysaccharide deacetylase family protein [Clostridium sp. B9]|uniref:polysaccharide deacetylase family protein n=1 Tax=Clostridium sp. B9 TaxID=3423224 RepID=UPI003D2F08B9
MKHLSTKKIILFIVFILLANISIVSAAEEPPSESKEVIKKVYLTFDDGPAGSVTESILNTLKENDVKGTFFLIGELVEKHPDLVKRMDDEGHAIGLHTFTHERNKVYQSNKSFLEENLKTQAAIENIIGKKVFLLRFPFGTNNSTYTLSKAMVDSLHSNGFKIYDWTVDSTDGLSPNLSPSSLLRKSSTKDDCAVLLMHCGYINKNSAKALPSIIDYFKKSGYSFEVIDENTPEIYRLKNKS